MYVLKTFGHREFNEYVSPSDHRVSLSFVCDLTLLQSSCSSGGVDNQDVRHDKCYQAFAQDF